MAKQKDVLTDAQKDAYTTIINELRKNHVKGKTTKGSIAKMEKALVKLGYTKDEVVENVEDLYFI